MIFDEGNWNLCPIDGEPDTFIGERREYVYFPQQNDEVLFGKVIIRAKFRKIGDEGKIHVYELIPTEVQNS